MDKANSKAELEQTREAALRLIETEGLFEGDRAASNPALAMVDLKKRIVEMSFSSEHPYSRDYGLEVLDHSPGSFDLSFLNSGQAPFMVAPKGGDLHNGAIQIGSIIKGSARIDADRKGRARVKVSRSADGDAFLNDIEDDVAINISFGYRAAQPQVTRDKTSGVATVRWMKVRPSEITRVPLAADPTVGVARADYQSPGHYTQNDRSKIPSEDFAGPNHTYPIVVPGDIGDAAHLVGHAADPSAVKTKIKSIARRKGHSFTAQLPSSWLGEMDAEDAADKGVDEATEGGRSDAGTNSNNEVKTLTAEEQNALEQARLDQITALGTRFKSSVKDSETIAARCALEGKSVEDARSAILEALNKGQTDKELTQTRDDDGAAKEPNIVIYSSVKSFTGSRQEAGLKAYRFAKWFVASALGHTESRAVNAAKQFCKDNGINVVRSQTEGDDTAGGFLVPHEFTNDMIDLREKYGVFRRNVRVVPMASDTKSMPRRKSGLTAYVIGEGKGATESKKGWDRVTLSAKKIGALARYSSEIAEDALVSIGDDLAQEIAYAFVKFEDAVGFTGDGSVDMMRVFGVLPRLQALADAGSHPGIVTASGNTWDEWEITDFLTAVGKLPEYAEIGNVKWYCSKVFWATVMQRMKLGLGGTLVGNLEEAGRKTFLGYDVEVSQTLPKTAGNGKVPVFLANLPMAAMLGDRRATTIATSGEAGDTFENDEFLVRGTERLDINVHNVEGIASEVAEGIAGPIVAIKSADS